MALRAPARSPDVAITVSRGHPVIRNLRGGFSSLAARVPVPQRLATAWSALATTL